ncbi:unnamed protein product [Rotaria magnacalcarata]|uniref:Uncharacterized protein n=1 Tax=Rotaria magnacalcarata TaxID=392030 RepID=A0A819J9R9_9BILA|nr:unnamed protein product [Rotaria magnacalcarata]
MSTSNQSIEPYYMQFLRCAKCSHVFEYENRSYHPITIPTCGHTMCKKYHRPIDQLPTNYPLLIILYDPSKLPKDHIRTLCADKTLGDISMAIKPMINSKECESVISRSMIRKIFSLLNSQYIEREGLSKFLKAMRSLAEHICLDIMLGHQNPQQLTNDVWSTVGFQNHTFYESAIQEKVLNHILSFFKHHAESQAEDIASFVIKDVHGNDRRDIRPIVDLLSGASCFQVFFTSPEQWSLLFYADTQHHLSVEKIIDNLSTPDLFSHAIEQFSNVIRRAGASSEHLLNLKSNFQRLSKIADDNQEYYLNPAIFTQLVLDAINELLQVLINF